MSEQDEWAGEREQRLRMIRDSAASLVPRDGDLSRVRRGRFTGSGWTARPGARSAPWAGRRCAWMKRWAAAAWA